MDRRATKDHYERENDEAERLVRPAPKVKPKRTDLRREQMQTERDPDVDGDPDLKGDPDMSLNYKNVGGSTGARVLARFLRADLDRSGNGRDDLVKVRKKDTGNVTYVTKERLQEEGGAYEVVQDDDAGGSDAPPQQPTEEEKPEAPVETKPPRPSLGDSPEAMEKLRTKVHELADADPNFLHALGRAILPDDEWAKLPGETPLTQFSELRGLSEEFPTIGDLRDWAKDVQENPEKYAPPKPPKGKKKQKGAPAAPPPKPAAPAPVDKPEAAPEQPAAEESKPEAPKTEESPPEGSPPEESPADDADDESDDEEDAAPPKPKSNLHPDDEKELTDWTAAGGFNTEEFKDWAGNQPGAKTTKDGAVVFFDDKRKKHIGFDQLSIEKQHALKQGFDGDVKAKANVLALKSNEAAQAVLADLANPKSDLMQALTKDKGALQKDPRRALEALKGVELPDSIDTVQDLVDAAKKLYPKIERRQVSEQEQMAARAQIIENFPYDVTKRLLALKLHPDDVNELLTTHRLVKSDGVKSIDEAMRLVGGGENYQLDPTKVRPPRVGTNSAGLEVPFTQLTPEEQATVLQKHRMRTVALSLAARDAVVDRLSKKTDGPDELLGQVADFTLSRPKDENPAQRSERAQASARELFEQSIARGQLEDDAAASRFDDVDTGPDDGEADAAVPRPEGLTDARIRRLFKELSDDPAAQQVAVGYLQAANYLDARKTFLSAEANERDRITEFQTPKEIWRRLQHATRFFDERAKAFPPETRWVNDPSSAFRSRVLDRIRTLAPEKYPFLKAWNDEALIEEHERKTKEWEKTFEANVSFRDSGATPPPRPSAPVGSDLASMSAKELKEKRKQLLEEHRRQMGLTDGESMPPKLAHMVLVASVASRFRRDSSYPSLQAMASADKKAVYHGVQPYGDTEPYAKWTQVHQCDLTESDHNALLKAAREWLRTPVLSKNIDGIVRDTQLRAALDLAIRTLDDGAYSVGLQPPVYNKLLARLAGEPVNETLLTVQAAVKRACGACACGGSTADSLYAPSGEEPPMKASTHIRSLAARYASTMPTLAYDLIDLADKVAEDEQSQQAPAEEPKQAGLPPEFLEQQKGKKDESEDKEQGDAQQKQAAYEALRSNVIRLAHANPHLRDAYLPLLQTIKQIG